MCVEAKGAAAQARRDSEALARRVAELDREEQHHGVNVGSLKKLRHVEDVAFGDVQAELQAAFRKREVLSEDAAAHSRARDALAEQLRHLRPELAEANERFRVLEAHLAERSRDLEEELAAQRQAQRELQDADAALRYQRRRAAEQGEADLGASSRRSASPAGGSGPPRYRLALEGGALRDPSLAGLGGRRRRFVACLLVVVCCLVVVCVLLFVSLLFVISERSAQARPRIAALRDSRRAR